MTAPSAPVIISAEAGDGSALLSFTSGDDGGSVITGYTASCKISTRGGIGTVEYASSSGFRLNSISKLPGNYEVTEECKALHVSVSGYWAWRTEGSDFTGEACDLEPDTDYYWNITFTDGVNVGSSTCEPTPCYVYIKAANNEYQN